MPTKTEAQASSDRKDPDPNLQTRAETEGRLTNSSMLLNVAKCLILIVIIPPFLNYASLQREGQMLLPKDGQMVDVGLGQKMHLLCKGKGKPVVILDAPTGMSSDVWFHVQESLATVTKVCAYDRMGLGFSRRMMLNETTGTEKIWGMSTTGRIKFAFAGDKGPGPNPVKQPHTIIPPAPNFTVNTMHTGRMVDDLHRLLQAAEIPKPFILVGSELGALNSRFYSHIHDVQVSDLVLIDPIPEDVFKEDQWKDYWYGKLLPSLQVGQFSAATGLSRMLIILGAIEPTIKGDNIPEDVIQRQKYLMSNPAHQSSAVDEHYFLNESAAQVGDITKFKPLTSRTPVSVITGDSFDQQIPAHLNQMVARLQKKFLEESYPSAKLIHIKGANRQMIHMNATLISEHLRRLVHRRRGNQQSE